MTKLLTALAASRPALDKAPAPAKGSGPCGRQSATQSQAVAAAFAKVAEAASQFRRKNTRQVSSKLAALAGELNAAGYAAQRSLARRTSEASSRAKGTVYQAQKLATKTAAQADRSIASRLENEQLGAEHRVIRRPTTPWR